MKRWMVAMMTGALLSCQGPAAVMAREVTTGDPADARALRVGVSRTP